MFERRMNPETCGRNRMRSLLCIGVTAASLTTTLGLGSGSAASIGTQEQAGVALPTVSIDPYVSWRVHNATDKTIFGGTVEKMETGAFSSMPVGEIDVTGLGPGQTRVGSYESGGWTYQNQTAVEELCWGDKKWELPGNLTHFQEWRDVYLFSGRDGLFITPEGAHDDRDLKMVGSC